MFSLTTTKLAVNVVSALGVSKVVGDIIKNNVTVVTTSQKLLVQAGGFVLGSMIVDHAVAHVNKMFDEVTDWVNKDKSDPTTSDAPEPSNLHVA